MQVIQKIPNNLTEFDEYFLQRTNETREPILPTFIPYMVPLHAYIETANLIFLILSYAPGEKLFDYIKKYAKSTPNTPAREVNLENVFRDPNRSNVNTDKKITEKKLNYPNSDQEFSKTSRNNTYSEQTFSKMSINNLNSEQTFSKTSRNYSNKEQTISKMSRNSTNSVVVFSGPDSNESHLETSKTDIANENLQNYVQMENNNVIVIDRQNEVSELVLNSQKLLLNVDKVLCGSANVSECAIKTEDSEEDTTKIKTNPRIQVST